MKPEQLYHELKDLAESLNLRVLEQNFRTTGIHVKSGYCKVKGIDHCIIDKHLKLNSKAEVLGECLSRLPLDSIEIMPDVREYLDSFKRGASIESVREDSPHNTADN